jgi:hypothetical protein
VIAGETCRVGKICRVLVRRNGPAALTPAWVFVAPDAQHVAGSHHADCDD